MRRKPKLKVKVKEDVSAFNAELLQLHRDGAFSEIGLPY